MFLVFLFDLFDKMIYDGKLLVLINDFERYYTSIYLENR
jgi:hypothetical protein